MKLSKITGFVFLVCSISIVSGIYPALAAAFVLIGSGLALLRKELL